VGTSAAVSGSEDLFPNDGKCFIGENSLFTDVAESPFTGITDKSTKRGKTIDFKKHIKVYWYPKIACQDLPPL
jgi:hypothetical protein